MGKRLGTVSRHNGFAILNQPITAFISWMFSSIQASSSLWHQQLGHSSNCVLHTLKSSSPIQMFELDPNDLCLECQFGTNHRLPSFYQQKVYFSIYQCAYLFMEPKPIKSISKCNIIYFHWQLHSFIIFSFIHLRKSVTFSLLSKISKPWFRLNLMQ